MSAINRSLRSAINKKCKDCIYDPLDQGTWRSQVERCSANHCPLFIVRPRSIKKNEYVSANEIVLLNSDMSDFSANKAQKPSIEAGPEPQEATDDNY